MTRSISKSNAQVVALSFDACWFQLPVERSARFLQIFPQVSIAAQAALRRSAPALYFADLEVFQNTRLAYPMLVYAASRPFRCQARADFTYDILNSELMRRFYVSATAALPSLLQQVYDRLRAAGMNELAREYRPELYREIIAIVDRLKVCRRRLEAILYAETVMVDNLIPFAGSRALTAKRRQKLAAKCTKVWLAKLRRFYARQDFTCIAPEVLDAGARALRSASRQLRRRSVPPLASQRASLGI